MERPSYTVLGGMAITVLSVALVEFAQLGDFDRVGVLIVVIAMGAASWPILRKTAEGSNDPAMLRFLVIALLLKLLSSYVRYYVSYDLFNGVTDSQGYHHAGWELAQRFQHLNFDLSGTELEAYGRETRNIAVVLGGLYTIIGANRMGGFLFFSWLSFCGLIFFQRAFQTAFPKGRHALHSRILFLLPSLLFWPSGTGKEGYMIFAIGVTMYGVAKLYTSETPLQGLGLALVGGWLVLQVRPHVALIVVVAAVAAVLARQPKRAVGSGTRVLRSVLLILLIPIGFVVVAHVHSYFGQEGAGSLKDALDVAQVRSDRGGSTYDTVPVTSPASVPLGWITVMYRPLPWEAGGGGPMLLASAEGTALMLGCAVFLLRPDRLIRVPLRNPYSMACFAYSLSFVVAFSNVGNFGILSRQRTQVYPLLLAFLIGLLPPATKGQRRDEPGEAEQDWAVEAGYEDPPQPAPPLPVRA